MMDNLQKMEVLYGKCFEGTNRSQERKLELHYSALSFWVEVVLAINCIV